MPWIKLFKFVVWINTLTAETRFIQRVIWCWLCLKEGGRTFDLQARLDICSLKILSSHIWTLYTHWICYISIITKMVLILICLYSLYFFTIFNDFLIFIWNTTFIWIKIIYSKACKPSLIGTFLPLKTEMLGDWICFFQVHGVVNSIVMV